MIRPVEGKRSFAGGGSTTKGQKMKSKNPEVALHEALAAALAKLMRLPPHRPGTKFRVGAMLVNKGDPAFENLMRMAGGAGVDYLIALSERQRDGSIQRGLALITTVRNATVAQAVEPARISPGQPVMLVSADRRHAWQLRDGALVSAAMPPLHKVERAIEAVAAEVGALVEEAPASNSRYVAIPIPSRARMAPSA